MPAVELESEPPAERQPEHMRPAQAERVDESGQAVGRIGEAEVLARIR